MAAAAAAGLAAGCTASDEDTKPDPEQLFFPTGAVIAPDGSKLFVANANSDLFFNGGAVLVVPIATVEAKVTEWLGMNTVPSGCRRDGDFIESVICDDAPILAETRDQGVRIGNFATDVAIQDLQNGRLRLIIPTRGDPSITWADWEPGERRLRCSADAGAVFDECDGDHRLSFVFSDDENAPIPGEPFAAFADSAGQYALVTHLTTGSVSLIDSPRDGRAQVVDIEANVFEVDPQTTRRGATGVAGRGANGIVYVGSSSEDRIQTFTVGRPPNAAPPYLLQGNWFFLDGVGNNANVNGGSNDTRGMAFSPAGDRLYLLNRKPPSLQVYDTSAGTTGFPQNKLIGAVDVCRQASTLAVVDSGDGPRVYLTCFQDGQIYVIDPSGRPEVEDIIIVGRGPYSVVASPDGKRLYVTNFLEDTVSVVDVTPGSRTRNRVVLRIGEPREP